MAILKVGFREGEKADGSDPSGWKKFLVESDTAITDDIDTILSANDGVNAIPAHNAAWSVGVTNLRVVKRRASAMDTEEGSQQGYFWEVLVSYAVPDAGSGQNEENPVNRDWLWGKGSDKQEEVRVASLLDTTGWIYPGTDAAHMVNLTLGDTFTNTAFEPPENGITGPKTDRVITLSRYINDYTDLGLLSWEALDAFIDTVNSDAVTLLGVAYAAWELRMDDIDYNPVSENGYDVIKVDFRIHVDTRYQHVVSFPSAGYNEIDATTKKLKRITNDAGDDVQSPRLLDKLGAKIAPPGTAPYIGKPYIVSGGVNSAVAWAALSLPAAIP